MPPARVYAPSPRSFDGRLRSPDYPNEAQVRRVRHCGTVKWRGQEVFLSQALTGEPIGLFASGDEL